VDACHDLVKQQVDHINQWYGTQTDVEHDQIRVTGQFYRTVSLSMDQASGSYSCLMSWRDGDWEGTADVK
jgi:hypothetical protein